MRVVPEPRRFVLVFLLLDEGGEPMFKGLVLLGSRVPVPGSDPGGFPKDTLGRVQRVKQS